MIHIDRLAYCSKLRKENPMVKLFFTIGTLLCCMTFNTLWTSVLTLLAMGVFNVFWGGVSFRLYIKLLLIPISFLGMGVLTIVVQTIGPNQSALWQCTLFSWHMGVMQEGLAEGVALFFKALGAVSCLYALTLNTPMTGILSTFRRLKVPPLFVELMGLIYRFIFVLMETSANMLSAQHARLGYRDIQTGYRSFGAMLSMLLIRALKRSNDLYTALDARGYQGDLTVLEEEYTDSRRTIIYGILLNGLLGAVWLIGRMI